MCKSLIVDIINPTSLICGFSGYKKSLKSDIILRIMFVIAKLSNGHRIDFYLN